MEDTPTCWTEYFPDHVYSPDDKKAHLIHNLCLFFLEKEGWEFLSNLRFVLRTYLTLSIDIEKLCAQSNINDLEAAVRYQPTECFSCIGAAVYEVLFEDDLLQQNFKQLLGCTPSRRFIFIRPFNTPTLCVGFPAIQCGVIDKLVCVRGTAIMVSRARPIVTEIKYKCSKCRAAVLVTCPDGRTKTPKSCVDGCRSRNFQADPQSIVTADWQKIRLQELLSASSDDQSRRVARTLDVEVTRDMVSSCACGDEVSVTGYVRVSQGDSSQTNSGVMHLHIEAISLFNHSCNESTKVQGWDRDQNKNFTPAELTFVRDFTTVHGNNMLLHLAHSLCPGILGLPLVKIALVLSLLGGSAKPGKMRTNIHVLLIGDPGLGKSQLLHACVAAAPRGMYVCSKTSTSAGLTLTVTKDVVTNEMAFAAGALVLADGGVCCLDELDNMRGEHRTLLEVMEQQEIRKGFDPQKAANDSPFLPLFHDSTMHAGGLYVRAKSLQENSKMGHALFSRFDVAFGLMDEGDPEHDHHLSSHVLRAYCGRKGEDAAQSIHHKCQSSYQQSQESGPNQSLKQKMDAYQCQSPLPAEMIKCFVSYARTYCQPKLTSDAKMLLKDFYLELRQKAASYSGFCVTTRQIESLVRLTEARARAELREEAFASDARDAIEIMTEAMRDIFRDHSSAFSRAAKRSKKGGGKRAQAATLLERLQQIKRLEGRKLFSRADLEVIADELMLFSTPVMELVDGLNEAGELLRKGGQQWALA